MTLVNVYYEEVDIFYHLLYRPKFERQVFQERLHESDHSFGNLVLAVCALASKYVTDYRVALDSGNAHTAGWLYYHQIRPKSTILTRTPRLCEVQTLAVRSTFIGFLLPFLISRFKALFDLSYQYK